MKIIIQITHEEYKTLTTMKPYTNEGQLHADDMALICRPDLSIYGYIRGKNDNDELRWVRRNNIAIIVGDIP